MGFKKWSKYTIDDVCSVTDCLHKTAPSVDYETPYRMLRTTNIRNGKIDAINTRSVSKETYLKWIVRGALVEEDVILTREAPMGEVGIIKKENYKLFLGQRLLQLKANRKIITPDFLFYSLQGRDLQHQIGMNEGTGSVVSNIRIPVLKKMEIHVPNLEVQVNITKSLRALDNKIEINEAIISNLEKLAQTLFKHWFVDFEFPNENGEPYKSSGGEMVESELGMIPVGWQSGKLTDIATLIMGQSPKSETYNEDGKGLPLINGASDFKKDHISPLKYTTDPKRISQKGDFLFGVRATVGNVTYVDKEYALGRGVGVGRANKDEYHEMLYFQLVNGIDYLKATATGSVYINLTKNDIEGMKLVLPNSDIVKKFHENTNSLFQQKDLLITQNNTLTVLRDTLLPKLLSGEIEIPDETEVTVNVPIS